MAEGLDPAPASFIQDDTRLLDEKFAAQVGRELQDAKTNLGLSIYVVAYPYIPRARCVIARWRWPTNGVVRHRVL